MITGKIKLTGIDINDEIFCIPDIFTVEDGKYAVAHIIIENGRIRGL